MKKMLLRGLSVVLCLVLMAIPVLATDGGAASLSSATALAGETVTLSVSLNGFSNADAMAIQISGLTPDSGAWVKSGTLSDFGGTAGVWAKDGGMDVNGEIFKLTFTAPAETTTVSVRVKVLSGDEKLYDKTVSGKITVLVPATGLSLSQSSVNLALGGTESQTLTATVTPGNSTDAVSWSSSNASVATVSGGIVTAVKPGTATITATAGSHSASCTVTVTCLHADLKEVAAKPATCAAAGNRLHYICNDCSATLDESKSVTTESQTIAQLTHTGGTATCTAQAVCTRCGNGYGDLAPHQPDTEWKTDANQHYHLCTVCTTSKTDAANHSFAWVTDKAATETATGLKHEECSVCGFKRNENTVIDKLPHTHTGGTATCKDKAVCTVCGESYGNLGNHTGGTATCIAKAICSVCDKSYGSLGAHKAGTEWKTDANQHYHLCTVCTTSKIDAASHSFAWITDKAATETATGLKHEECSVCGFKRNENTVIDKLPHTHTGGTATCKDKAICSVCGESYGELGAHKPGTEWKTDDKQHYHQCPVCTTEKLDAADHTFNWVTDKAATESTTGLKHEACSTCGLKRNEKTEIEKLKHAPKLVEGKESTCTEDGLADHFYCANCNGYFAVVDGKCGSRITKAETILPATGHTYNNTYVYDSENHWRYCSCGEAEEAQAHTYDDDRDESCNLCEFKREIATEIPTESVTEATESVSMTETPDAADQQPATEAVPQEPAQEGNGSGGTLILFVVLLAVAAGIAGYVVLKKRK